MRLGLRHNRRCHQDVVGHSMIQHHGASLDTRIVAVSPELPLPGELRLRSGGAVAGIGRGIGADVVTLAPEQATEYCAGTAT